MAVYPGQTNVITRWPYDRVPLSVVNDKKPFEKMFVKWRYKSYPLVRDMTILSAFCFLHMIVAL